MKKILFILMVTFLAVLPAVAQDKTLSPEKLKEYREYKMKFLAQEMELKGDAINKFFEVYNQYSDERKEIRREMYFINMKIKENMATDFDYTTLKRLQDQESELERKYDNKFATFLSSKEIFKMKQAEKVFMQKLKEMKAKKNKKKK